MWVREVPPTKWEHTDPNNPRHVEDAIESLLHGGGDFDLSFFRVEDEADLERVAYLWAITVREIPATRVFLVLTDEDFKDFDFCSKQDPTLHPVLCSRHVEAQGLQDPQRLKLFVQRAMARKRFYRCSLGQLKKAFSTLYNNDPIVKAKASDAWKKFLKG
jgi:hypothetical protein